MFKCCLNCKKKDEVERIYHFWDICDRCGKKGAVAEIEFRPQVIDDIFQAFKNEDK